MSDHDYWNQEQVDDDHARAIANAEAKLDQEQIEFNKRVGAEFRKARVQLGMSLQAVADDTNNEFKGSVLGAYERGERTLTVPRMWRLCQYYGISPSELVSSVMSEPERCESCGQILQ